MHDLMIGLVLKKASLPIIMEYYLPSSLLINVLSISRSHIIADNLNVFGLRTNKMQQQCTNDWNHSTAKHDYWYIVLSAPSIELLERRIKLDVLEQCLDTLIIRSLDTIHHSLERLSECHPVVKHICIALLSKWLAITKVVCEVIIGIAKGYGTIEVGEEYELWVCSHSRKGGSSHLEWGMCNSEELSDQL